jgi:uncharacterized membrane protein YfbV (UPF0208 family)
MPLAQAAEWGWLLNQGLAVAALLFIGWYAVKGITWLGSNFLLPLRDAALDYLKKSTETMQKISNTLESQQSQIESMTAKLEILDLIAERYVATCERRDARQSSATHAEPA